VTISNSGMVGHQLPGPPRKAPVRRLPDLQSEGPAKNAAQMILDVRSFDCTSLRAVSIARVSCAPIDLQCTGGTSRAASVVLSRAHRCDRTSPASP